MRFPLAEVEVEEVGGARSVAGVSDIALALPLPLRPADDVEAELAARLEDEADDTPAPAGEGVA